MPLAFHYAARSDVGLVRSENQDSAYAGPHLLVVADGMGGHAGGDIASSTVIGYLVELDDESHGGNETGDELARALEDANDELGRLVAERPALAGMGTTVTALLRARNKVAIAHIGDSRAYVLREGQFAQITRDHSFVQTLIDQGTITPEEATSHPQRSLVTRVLTGGPRDKPDLGAREIHFGDRVLLCSDGLSGFVATDTIAEILREAKGPDAAADRLVELALRAGAPDNVTVLVADVVDVRTGPPPPVQPQIVGAAAVSPAGTREQLSSPATKAAALRTSVDLDEESETVERLALAEESAPSRTGRLLRVLGVVLVAAIVLVGGSYAAYVWSQRQYYLGDQDGKVTIFQGVGYDLGPVTLSEAVQVTDIPVVDLPDYYRQEVTAGVSVESVAAAQATVVDLRKRAAECTAKKARGQTCGADVPAAGTTSSSSSSSGGTLP